MSLFGARDRLRFAPLAFAGLLLSCGPTEPGTPPRPASPPPDLEVEYSGCWAIYLPGPVCALWPRPDPQLKLWLKADSRSRVEIRVDGQDLAAAGQEVSGGRRYQLSIPSHASLLSVSIQTPGTSRGPTWSLRLTEPDKPAWLDEVGSLRESGKRKKARHWLEQLQKSAAHGERSFALRSLALLARDDGYHEAQEQYLKLGMSVDRADHRWSGEVDKAALLAGLYIDHGRFSEARQSLANLRFPAKAPADAKWLVAYYQGLLGNAVGDYRSALEQLRKADHLAERVGMKKYRWDAQQVEAYILQYLGRTSEASRLFASLREDPQTNRPCDLGSLLTNSGWSQLVARESGEEAEDPTPILEEAQGVYDQYDCTPEQRLNARLNLARAHQQAGRLVEARRALDQVRAMAARPTLLQRLWWDDLEGRAAILEGDPDRALSLYGELDRVAKLAFSAEGRLRAALGLAKARLALSQATAAIDALAAADRLIDEESWHVPAHEGRDTFLAQREEATRLYLQLLLEDGQRKRAFELARRARSRLLRQVTVTDRLAQLTPKEQKAWDESVSKYRALRDAIDRQVNREWQLSGDEVERAREAQATQLAEARDVLDRALASLGAPGEGSLSPPGPGEVILIYHPLPQGRWVGFAATVRGIDVATFGLPSEMPMDRELAQTLLEPFHAVIETSARVRVLPYGRLRSVDFHALPFSGEILLARHLVVYSLDLPVRTSSAPAASRPVALLVSNPQGDLPAAREEVTAVAAAIRARGSHWSLERLDGAEARAESVSAALPGATFFHYAGHGNFAGFAGWDSYLPLADGSRLTLGDVLAVRPAPAWVVLSACDGGRSSDKAPTEGIGLANAFLLAGSQGVVAASRPVGDRSARDLMRELYREWQRGVDLPRQLQRAQLACRRKDPTADAAWVSFRLLLP